MLRLATNCNPLQRHPGLVEPTTLAAVEEPADLEHLIKGADDVRNNNICADFKMTCNHTRPHAPEFASRPLHRPRLRVTNLGASQRCPGSVRETNSRFGPCLC